MSEAMPTDYLGHPCALTAARELFDEPLSEARQLKSREPREIQRQIGILLNTITERRNHESDALGVLLQHMVNLNSDDTDGAVGVLNMGAHYSMETDACFRRLAGLVLAALEVSPQREASHG